MAVISLSRRAGHMAAGRRRIFRPGRVLCFAIMIPLLGVSNARGATTEPESDVGVVAAMAVGSMQPKLITLQPGLLIGDKPPQGWSHLVIKSIPRLASGEKDSLPSGSAKTAAYF